MMGRLNPSLDLSISHRAVSEIFPDRLLFVPCTPLRERESSSCAACREVHPTSACTCTWTRTCMYNIWQKKRRWLSPHRTSALMCERKLCGRQGLRTIGPTVDLPANMQEGKRRSLRSQAPETGGRLAVCGRPPTNRSPLAVREDGGVVWSSDGAPFAHPCRVCSRLCVF